MPYSFDVSVQYGSQEEEEEYVSDIDEEEEEEEYDEGDPYWGMDLVERKKYLRELYLRSIARYIY